MQYRVPFESGRLCPRCVPSTETASPGSKATRKQGPSPSRLHQDSTKTPQESTEADRPQASARMAPSLYRTYPFIYRAWPSRLRQRHKLPGAAPMVHLWYTYGASAEGAAHAGRSVSWALGPCYPLGPWPCYPLGPCYAGRLYAMVLSTWRLAPSASTRMFAQTTSSFLCREHAARSSASWLCGGEPQGSRRGAAGFSARHLDTPSVRAAPSSTPLVPL